MSQRSFAKTSSTHRAKFVSTGLFKSISVKNTFISVRKSEFLRLEMPGLQKNVRDRASLQVSAQIASIRFNFESMGRCVWR